MCCWHSLWLHCVSSKAVRHSLVTQGELLISQERDVLASALGSFEDKQTYVPCVMASATRRRTPRSLEEDAATSRISHSCPPFLLLARCAAPRSAPGRAPRLGLRTAPVCVEPRPLCVNPVTLECTLVEGGENSPCDATVPLWKSYVLKFKLAIFSF